MYKYVSILIISCFSVLFDGPIIVEKLDDAFTESKESKKDLLVVFSADWCVNCVTFKKHFQEDMGMLSGIVVCIVDYDTNLDIAKEYKVKKIPDFRYYRESVELDKKIGYSKKSEFVKWLEQNRSKEK